MYVQINGEYIALEQAAKILGIDQDTLTAAGHSFKSKTEVSFINYSI